MAWEENFFRGYNCTTAIPETVLTEWPDRHAHSSGYMHFIFHFPGFLLASCILSMKILLVFYQNIEKAN